MQAQHVTHSAHVQDPDDYDINLVEIWLRRDPVRWAAGAAAGIFAGIVMLVFAGLLSSIGSMEFLFPVKLMAMPILGYPATELGMHFGALFTGFLVTEVLCAFLGALYAHFTGTNYLPALLGVGLVWGTFSWIFICNLFGPAFFTVRFAGVSNGPTFPICIVFGLALTSVAFFDRALRGKEL